MNDRILTEVDGHVLDICVNRPEKHNAFDLATLEQLAAAYQRLAEDLQLRAGLLCARGGHFSVGARSRRGGSGCHRARSRRAGVRAPL